MSQEADPRLALERFMIEHAYQYRPDAPFTLVSGATSPEYLDCKLALGHGAAMAALGRTLLRMLVDDVSAVGGLTMGADPLAYAAATIAGEEGRPLRWFSVRKESKGHGQRKRIEGAVAHGDRVTVVDDVVTSGGSTLQAIDQARAGGLQVAQVLVLVDREQGGMDAIREAVGDEVPVRAVFTLTQIREAWTAHQQ